MTSTRESITEAGLRNSSAKRLPPGTILLTSRATIGEARIAGMEMCTNQGFKNLIAKPGYDPTFLYYQACRLRPQFERFGVGSTFPEINKRDVSRVEFDCPPDEEQQREVGRVLSSLDRQIEETLKGVAKQEHVHAGLMQDLFARGVDGNGRLRPTREEAPHLYHETGIGWLPKEWTPGRLSSLIPKAVYGSSEGLTDDPNGVPVLRMNNIQAGGIDVTDLRYAKSEPAASLLLKRGDLLFNRTNSMEHVGKAAIWRDELPKSSFASYLVRLDCEPHTMRTEYMLHWLNLPSTQNAMRRFATPGVHQVNINPTNLRRLTCPHPRSLLEQEVIVSLIRDSDRGLSVERQAVAKLRCQRAGLMRDLLNAPATVESDVEGRAA